MIRPASGPADLEHIPAGRNVRVKREHTDTPSAERDAGRKAAGTTPPPDQLHGEETVPTGVPLGRRAVDRNSPSHGGADVSGSSSSTASGGSPNKVRISTRVSAAAGAGGINISRLPTPLLARIFAFVDTRPKISVLPPMCRAFYDACRMPDAWESVDAEKIKHGLDDGRLMVMSDAWSKLKSACLFECIDITAAGMETLLTRARHLTTLDLTGCNALGDEVLARVGETQKELRNLNITCCRVMTDAGVASVAEGCRDLQAVSLWGCPQLTDAAVIQLARHCPKLEYLNLTWLKNVSDPAFRELNASCPSLQYLNLTWCERVRDTCLSILRGCSMLQVVGLDGCSRLSDVGILALAHNAPKLRKISMRFLSKVTSESVLQLPRLCVHLVLLDARNCDLLEEEDLSKVVFRPDIRVLLS